MNTIIITLEDISLQAEIFDTPTGRAVLDALPFEGSANLWGDEIYFEIPVSPVQEPDARKDVTVGDLGYWPLGSAFCIFFGPTPMSQGDAPRAYSPVNIFGRILGDAKAFKTVADGALVQVMKA
jgi:hypothetical protein